MIDVQNVSKVYEMPGESLRVLEAVNLQVATGETAAVVGPSGSGKTTLLNLLGVLDRPSEGRVLIDGRDVASFGEEQAAAFRNQSLGFVFQHHHLLPQCSVLENVVLPRLAGSWAEAEAETTARAEELLAEVGLQDRLAHFPYQLSGGERLRTALARALVNEPRLVLADEPTGSLDEETTGVVADLLEQLNAQMGVTLVVVTHNAALARRMQNYYELRGGNLEKQ
ncbi:MAG: ABC transporter ATP-binding protein [Roseibacillus sp.]|nr:ABC transporter ATP-binding protein [Roseibacillus sp.]